MWRSEGNGWTGSRAVRLHGVLQSWKKRLAGGVFSGCLVYGRGWGGIGGGLWQTSPTFIH